MRSAAFGVGGLGFAADAVSSSRGRLKVGGHAFPGFVASFPLVTEGMPYVAIWAKQTSPIVAGAGATVSLEFMVRALTAGDDDSDEWLPLLAPTVLAPGAPGFIVLEASFPCTKIRLAAASAEDAGETTIEYILGCHA